uniref:Uncharacterized protein n=1 Tax=Anopheles darlingi TaxID=43151 RepID=A0A2M4DRE9_ANODA
MRVPVVAVPPLAATIAVAAVAVAAVVVAVAAAVPAVVVAPRHRAAHRNRPPIVGVRHDPDHHRQPVHRPGSRRQPAPERSVRSSTRCVRCSDAWNRSSSSTTTFLWRIQRSPSLTQLAGKTRSACSIGFPKRCTTCPTPSTPSAI